MLNILPSLFSRGTKQAMITINRTEQKEILLSVLKHSLSTINHYSIYDPNRQHIDLMLAPTLIEEAIDMLNNNYVEAQSLLIDYLAVKHKRG